MNLEMLSPHMQIIMRNMLLIAKENINGKPDDRIGFKLNRNQGGQASLFSVWAIHPSMSEDDHLTLRPILVGCGKFPCFIHL